MRPNIETAEGMSEGASILRFMSFTKFADLITSSRVFLPNIATMQKDDPLEGVLPLANIIVESGITGALDHFVNDMMPRLSESGRPGLRGLPPRNAPTPAYDTVFGSWLLKDKGLEELLRSQAAWLDIQCWHRSDVESVAMWKIYGGSEPSVAIRSTVERLTENLYPKDGDRLYISPITYIDHGGDPCEITHPLAPFLRKALPYEYEREIRVIAYTPDQDIFAERAEPGRYLDAHLEDLMSEVIVSPTAPPWFLNLVARLTALKTTAPVSRSKVNQMPY